jgi:hypothetical protein
VSESPDLAIDPPPRDDDLVAALVRLCRRLRARGLAVTPSETLDAARALGLADLLDATEVREALRAVLTSRHEESAIFDECFDDAWRLRRAGSPVPLPGAHTTLTRPLAALSARSPAPSLEEWLDSSAADEDDEVTMPRASADERLETRDFSQWRSSEDPEFHRLAARIARRLALRPSRRWRGSHRRGARIDLRRSIRASLGSHGEMLRLLRRRRRIRRTRLVAVCDVSGSMTLYARMFLQLLHALQNSFAHVETFVFATRLSHLSSPLRGASYAQALDRLGSIVRDWSGGTRIGESLETLVGTFRHLLDRRTVVVMLSDGWDVGDPARLEQAMRALRARVGKIVWLNPLMGALDYAPDARGMRAALPHIDVLAPAHNLRSLQRVTRELAI